jgi:hypothetical protein
MRQHRQIQFSDRPATRLGSDELEVVVMKEASINRSFLGVASSFFRFPPYSRPLESQNGTAFRDRQSVNLSPDVAAALN